MLLQPHTIRLLAMLVLIMSLPAALLLGGRVAVTGSPVASVASVTLENLHDSVDLRGHWRFQPGDNPGWAAPEYDDSGWQSLSLPHRWERGGYPETGQMGWYRLTLQLDREIVSSNNARTQMAIAIGNVMSAYELYVGGRRLGGVGSLPPLSESLYDKQQFYIIPESLIDDQGRLVLAVRVWGGENGAVAAWGAGPYSGEFLLGEYRSLILTGVVAGLPVLMFFALSIAFGAHHLLIFLRNRSLAAYLWFSLLALDMAIYGLTLSQWKYLLPLSFVTLKKIEFAALYIFPALSSQLLLSLIERKITWPIRFYQLSYLLAGMVVIVVPGHAILYKSLPIWQVSVLPIFVLLPWALVREARRGNAEAHTILPAVAFFLATCVYDLSIEVFYIDGIRLMPLGFIAMLMGMSFSLVNSFTRMYHQLEHEVEQRTAELSEVNRRLIETARVDPLTGVLNRRGFAEEAEGEIQRFLRTGVGFSVVLADVDYFKRFNDNHGHICGDHVLKKVADTLLKRTRDIDRIGRWGGEEFILLLPETDAEGAAVLAEKLRDAVATNVFEFKGKRMTLTMTFGVSAFRKGDSLDSCLTRADTALYHGKQEGRNRVMIGSPQGLSLVN